MVLLKPSSAHLLSMIRLYGFCLWPLSTAPLCHCVQGDILHRVF